jgi:HD superfamily phosphohydrolase
MILRDPVHGLVSFETTELAIVPQLLDTPELQRLRRIRQLGLSSFAYPGADHTRFAHAVGAAHVMSRFITRLREIHEELPYWQRVTTERARDAVVAALVHDVGHGPFSHLFEAALPEGPRHEVWTRRVIESPETALHKVLVQIDPGLPARVTALVRGEHELPYLANTVSGAFDVDRCDYLLRDAHATGVSYGSFDLDWLLRSLRFGVPDSPTRAPALAIDGAKGLPAIESFTLARHFMFQQVYFHKASRASDYMLTSILARVRQLVEDGTRLEAVPPAIVSIVTSGDASLRDYLALDDGVLWAGLTAWRECADPLLADLCARLVARNLFKTYELFEEERTTEQEEALLGLARSIAKARGYDPEVYVGLDRAKDVPYDDGKDTLRVIFPSGAVRAPADVSFLLGRLRSQVVRRTRLIFPDDVRREFLAARNQGAS